MANSKKFQPYDRVEVSIDGKEWKETIIVAEIKGASNPYVTVYPDDEQLSLYLRGKEFATLQVSHCRKKQQIYKDNKAELFIDYPYKNRNKDCKVQVSCKVSSRDDIKDLGYHNFTIKLFRDDTTIDITDAIEALGLLEKVVDEIPNSEWMAEYSKYLETKNVII